jgi:hypothetical protein
MISPDPIDRLIAAWREPAPPAPDLRRRVWRRIEASERRRRFIALPSLAEVFSLVFGQRATFAWLLLCIGLGCLTAELRATRTPARDLARIAAVYIEAYNPLLRFDGGGPP